MRHSWRFILFRTYSRSHLRAHFISPVLTHPASRSHSFHNISSQFQLRNLSILNYKNIPINHHCSSFSSEAAVERKDLDHVLVTVTDIFNRCSDTNDIKRELDLSDIVFSHEMILKVLRSVESNPVVASGFFDWVLERYGEKLSSKSYNGMLCILGVNGLVDEFWVLFDAMKKKGYGISGGVHRKVVEKFEKEGLESDLERLKGVFASGSIDNSMEKVCSRASKIVRSDLWGDKVEERLRNLNVTFSNYMVKMVSESLATEPAKALIFFRWTEDHGSVKHDEQSYNAMARVLGREDYIDRFWKIVDEMKSIGHEMEMETYVKVLGCFCKRKMLKEAVDLYDFAMAGSNKPSVSCCTFLLKKIAAAKQLDIDLFSRVVMIFKESGNVLTDSMVDAVLKSLTSVGRLGECNKVLKAMEEGGFVVRGNMQSKISFRLASTGVNGATAEFIDHVKATNTNLDHKTWASLIQGCCAAGKIETASAYFQNMVEKEGVYHAGYAFEWLVNSYCRRERVKDACKLLHKYSNENQLRPLRSTYKELIVKLLAQDCFKDATGLLGSMIHHGYPPFVDPFIPYVSKRGSSDDAVAFLKAITSKSFPSITVVLHVFEAFLKASRQNEAQDLLAKCPGYVRNHADVLNLFYSMRTGEVVESTPKAAV